MATRKHKHTCSRCDETFATITEQMCHFVQQHDRGFVPREQRTRRATACWRCNSDIPRDTNVCKCGWVHPYVIPLGQPA